jgi:uncharacterized protein YfaS (alpha-2-macroglobulin family)
MKLITQALLLALFTITFSNSKAENMENKNDWTKVDKLESEGKTKDALLLVNNFLLNAQKNKNTNQIIKSNLYIYKYKMILEEESEWKIVQELKQNIQQTQGAEKALLHSILAELLNQYYQNNTWKFADRTKTEIVQSEDFRTWDLQTLFENISTHYKSSLQEKDMLQKIKLEEINEILFNEKKSKMYRPTLYDFLAHRAIDFFSTDYADFPQPANAFSINKEQYFADVKTFINLKIDTEDTMSNSLAAIQIFQDLLRFRLSENQNLEALADADVKRLQYIKDHYFDKDEAQILYYNALLYTKEKYTKTPYGDELHYLLAQFINQNIGNAFLNNKVEDKETFTPKNVMKICNDAVLYYPNSEGAKNCMALAKSLQQKSLNLNTEKVLVPNQKHNALVTYKNINKIYLKWIKLAYAEKDKIFELKDKETQETIVKRLNDRKATKSWTQDLSNKLDYLEHKSEIILPEITQGFYVLMSSTNPNFSISEDKNAVAINQVFISNISYITKTEGNNFEIYVLDRKSSKPIKDAQINLFKKEYNYDTRKYIYNKIETLTSDENGYATKKILLDNNNYYNNHFQIEIKDKEDFLAGEQTHYVHQYQEQEQVPQNNIQLFTDRAIYRPTQTIYFKGILTEYYKEENKVIADQKISIIFKDANYQEIAKQELTTNSFGSFSGTFTAPATGMLGNMILETQYGSKNIQIEEYKRPKFEVLFDTVKTAYNLNDTINITGKAQSYAAAILDNAEVKYTVTRVPHFPIWCWWNWRRPYMPPTAEKIIAVGKTKTDENGKYNIDFQAIPDLSLDKSLKPYFNYKIAVDVTDINGETQSNQTEIRVGYLAIEASMQIADNINTERENKIIVSTNNLNGQPEPTQVEIKIYNLYPPKNPLKDKLWQTQDEFLISKIAYQNLFPYDVYDNEDKPINWEKNKLLYMYNFNTKDKNEIVFKPNELSNGVYLVEFSCKDKLNNNIAFSQVFKASSFQEASTNPKTFLDLKVKNNTLQPKDTLQFSIKSSLKNVYAIVEAKHQNKWLEKKIILLDKNTQTFSIPIKEEYRGGVQIKCYTILENRFHAANQFVNIPYPNKDLKIEWQTFRDKLLPGQKEIWKLKISGNDKDKVSAELLTTMYDASLDAFIKHSFDFSLQGKIYTNNLTSFSANDGFGITYPQIYHSKNWYEYGNFTQQNYDRLNLYGLYLGTPNYYYRGGKGMYMMKSMALESAMVVSDGAPAPIGNDIAANTTQNKVELEEVADTSIKKDTKNENAPKVTPRSNLNETAFFFPQLKTDEEGNIILEFTMPEALTRWNLLGLAHTKDLQTTQFSKSIITQKELMVVPNAPRFMREGDTIIFSSKITNLSDRNLDGKTTLNLIDALTGKNINTLFKNNIATQNFKVVKGQNTVAFWKIVVPKNISAITYEIIAQAENFSDGEQNTIPVLSNRMMVTEALPLWISGKDTKKYTFKKLLENKSTTLQHHALTLEMSSNPAWYAIQALPYLMEYPYECAEQLFSRYYANSLATHIANSNPKIKKVFEKWKTTNSEALLSNLEKNQELKNVLLEESPWVRDAQNETEQKKRIALLFDLNKMATEQQNAFDKLEKLQSSNGGFMWFAGMPENRFITQYIVEGIGHLDKLKVINLKEDKRISSISDKAIYYLDDRMQEDYENIKKYDKDYQKNNYLNNFITHYLYMRSFFMDNKIKAQHTEAYNFFLNQAKKYWNNTNMYDKAMLSMILFRNNEPKLANTIIESFKQNAINSEELGIYWKSVENGGWYWYEAPVETQALIIEAFTEITKEEKSIDAMKLWLLKQKQTTSWKTTKATAEACYALLLSGSNWIESNNIVEVSLNNVKVSPTNIEEGTGYYKTKWTGNEVKPELAKISIKKKDKGPAYGAMYWQYFEDLDKITNANTNLQLNKKYFIKESTKKGNVLKEITEKTPIKVGDLITVRIELKTDRNLEFVHLKDMRAAGTEPTNVLSQYKWQDGFGYYETTKDVATHFFIDWLNKGTYVFEYTIRASLAGNFSSGITQIECMYAPEFKAHSNGQRQTITENKD